MFFEELSRIKVDMVANYRNLEAVAQWCEHLDVSDEAKEMFLKNLTNSISYLTPAIDKVFHDENDGMKKLLHDIQNELKRNG